MLPHFTTTFDSQALRAFEDDRRRRLLVAVRYACLASVLALAAFSVFDTFWHVADQHGPLATRTVTLAALLLVLVASFTPLGVRYIDPLAVVACLFFCGGTVLVAEMAAGGLSIYRDPIYLLLIGFTLLIPWKPGAAALCFATSIAFYNVLYLFTGGMGYIGTWLVSNVMLAVGGVIATFSVGEINRLRRAEFGYRRRLQMLDERLFAMDAVDQVYPSLARDLRAPLSLFMTALESLQQGHGGGTGEAQRQAVDLCRRNAVRLVSLVDEQLAMSHLKTDGPVREIDVVGFARRLLAELAPLAERQRVHMSMQDLPTSLTIGCDPSVLEQATLSMLAFALDSGAGGDVRMSVIRRDQGAEVQVEDNGVGLTAQEVAALFSPPTLRDGQVLALRRHGLSLAAAKQRVTAMGGTLTASSEMGHGTVLHLWLPRMPTVPVDV